MNIEEIASLLRHEIRTIATQSEQLVALPHLTRHLSTSGGGNRVTAFNLEAAHADEGIAAEVAHFDDLGQSFEWKVFSFDSPPNLLDRLVAAGFSVGAQEVIVVYDLENGLGPFSGSYPCGVSRIVRTEQLADFRFVAESVFGKDYGPTTSELAEAIESGREGHLAYVGHIEGEPVSIGRLYTDSASAFAGLYSGGTRTEFRGRGCYRAILAARARDAALAGSKYLLVDALPTSLRILEQLGFVPIAYTWPCSSPLRGSVRTPTSTG